MRRPGVPILLVGLCFGLAALADDPAPPRVEPKAEKTEPEGFDTAVGPFLARYCVSCHGAEKPKAGLDLAKFRETADVLQARRLWERVVDYVASGEMPPARRGVKKPTDAEAEAVVAWLEGQLTSSACAL